MKPKLLTFGISYAPEPISTGVNTTWQAEALTELGWDVTVVTGIPHYPWWEARPAPPMPPDYPVQVIRRRHHVPPRQSVGQRLLYESSWVASSLPVLTARREVDLVMGIVPNLGGAALAAAAAARYRVPYVLLIQDIVGRAAERSGISGAGRVAGSVAKVETWLARRASAVAVVADGFRDYFVQGGVDPARIHRVRNPARLQPPTEDRASVRRRMNWAADDFIVLHSGAISYKQGLEGLLRTADHARDQTNLRFILQGEGSMRAELETMAQQLQLPNVTFAPLAPEEEYSSILAAADALLLYQRPTVRNMSFPAKLGSYFAAGVPVIAAVDEEDETATEIRGANAGIVVAPDDPQALLSAIDALRRNPEKAACLGAAGQTYADQKLSPDAAIQRINSVLQQALSDGHPELLTGEKK
ncbi:glycosyltransferase [Mycobacterium sp. OAE908]|uniref:glycosyltransferase n=1 Tax=Mycobacterium sp. OAE908 TaxID=2817899 RepID=UPI001AE60246